MYEEAQSVLLEGIETVVIPVHNPHDLEQLVFRTQRGGEYDVVEWVLGELSRLTELERVCGLVVTPTQGGVTINLQMRQPGKQLELWVRGIKPGMGLVISRTNDGSRYFTGSMHPSNAETVLCARAMPQAKFTDLHRPWWEASVAETVTPEVDTAEHRREAHQG
jgi:hypothetical protein